MRLKTVKFLGLAVSVIAGLATAANAQIVTYEWVPGNYTTYVGATPGSSGSMTVNWGTDTVTAFSFTETPGGTDGLNTLILPSVASLGDGDALLTAYLIDFGAGNVNLSFNEAGNGPGPTPGINENYVQDNGTLGGDWVAVPEPLTIVSGAMLLLPFGASTLRILRRRQAA